MMILLRRDYHTRSALDHLFHFGIVVGEDARYHFEASRRNINMFR